MSNADQIILIFDVETTGLNTNHDQIIEFAFQKGLGEDAFRKSWRFRPSIPIPIQATGVHGITDEDVANCPPFSSAVETIRKIFIGSDVIIGYNVGFDLEMVVSEFKRAKAQPLDLGNKTIIDPRRLWSKCEPRKLEDAVRRFAGREHSDAHSGLADVQATGEVLEGMLKAFTLQGTSWSNLADFIDPGRKERIGGTDHLTWKEGKIVFGFGKHKNRPLIEVIKEDPNYARWISSSDFPEHVKTILVKATQLEEKEFYKWAQTEFGINGIIS